MVGPAVPIGVADPILPITPTLEHVAASPDAAIRVGATDVRWRHAAPDRLVAELPVLAVAVGPALGAELEERLAEGPLRGAVLIVLAADAGVVDATDPIGAVVVVGAGHALAATGIADRCRAVALGRVCAIDAAIVHDVTPLRAAVCVHATAHAGLGVRIADAGRAVVVGHAVHAAITLAIAPLAVWAIERTRAAVADAVRATAAARAVPIHDAGDAPVVRGEAATALAVSVHGALDAAALGVAVAAGAVGVHEARRAPTGGDIAATPATVQIERALRALTLGPTKPAHRAVAVDDTLDADPVPASQPGPTVRVHAAPDAEVFGAARRRAIAAVGVDPARDAGVALADARGAVGIFDAGLAGPLDRVAAALGAVGVHQADHADRGRRLTATPLAVGVGAAANAGHQAAIADPPAAVFIGGALDAAAVGRIAEAAAEAVAVARAFDAGVRHRIADRTRRTLRSPSALHAAVVASQANALLAVPVGDAVHTEPEAEIAAAARALGVSRTRHAASAGEIAAAALTRIVRQAADAEPAHRLAALALRAVRIAEALAAEAPELWSAAARGWAGVHERVTGGDAAAPQGLTDLQRWAVDLGAGRARAALAVARDTGTVRAVKARGAALLGRTLRRAVLAVRHDPTYVSGPAALGVDGARRAGAFAEGPAEARLGHTRLPFGASVAGAAVARGLADLKRDVAPRAGWAVSLGFAGSSDAATGRDVAARARAEVIAHAGERRGVAGAHDRVRRLRG